jgi:threonine synthase
MAGADHEAGFRGEERWDGLKPTNDETDGGGAGVGRGSGGLGTPALRRMEGFLVPDAKILRAGRVLAREEGIFVEPAAAASLAGAAAAKRSGYTRGSDTMARLLTGHGLKYQGEGRDQAELEAVGEEVGLARAIEMDLGRYA